jgi:TetR/AcrR family transcriptional repressor of nem operon
MGWVLCDSTPAEAPVKRLKIHNGEKMGRVSKEQMLRKRNDIISVSSELFRERGLEGVSVSDIMAAMGLTHGGFYGHFSSKDELEALACKRALDDASKQLFAKGVTTSDDLVDYYLSAGTGGTVAALASDVMRKPPEKPVRQAYIAGVKRLAEQLASLQKTGQDHLPEDGHLAQLAMMTGALILARATEGDEISVRFLTAVRKCLHSSS